VDVSIIMP